MVKELISGKMGGNIKDNIDMIKNMDMVFIHGQMEGNIVESGKIVKDMVKGR